LNIVLLILCGFDKAGVRLRVRSRRHCEPTVARRVKSVSANEKKSNAE
jgi:hypothetical protein